MKRSLETARLSRPELTELLGSSVVVDSSDAGGVTVYRLAQGSRERIVVALPDGGGLAVGIATILPGERRQRSEA